MKTSEDHPHNVQLLLLVPDGIGDAGMHSVGTALHCPVLTGECVLPILLCCLEEGKRGRQLKAPRHPTSPVTTGQSTTAKTSFFYLPTLELPVVTLFYDTRRVSLIQY
ncbi:hypothetical protein E2C01_026053 [Portunus trituberculatus]|uniref:Uncharacterized protein n=1 Tax=Portunus trituberculatus TaxID=210409 RepID=A0A5B7EHD1_PORTR|nr:hypothetical protein [Portunus trituberculatus]